MPMKNDEYNRETSTLWKHGSAFGVMNEYNAWFCETCIEKECPGCSVSAPSKYKSKN